MQTKQRFLRLVIQFIGGWLCALGMGMGVAFLIIPIIGYILALVEEISGAKFLYLVSYELLLAALLILCVPSGSVIGIVLVNKLFDKSVPLFNASRIIRALLLGIIGSFLFVWGLPVIVDVFWPGLDLIGSDLLGVILIVSSASLFAVFGYNTRWSFWKG